MNPASTTLLNFLHAITRCFTVSQALLRSICKKIGERVPSITRSGLPLTDLRLVYEGKETSAKVIVLIDVSGNIRLLYRSGFPHCNTFQIIVSLRIIADNSSAHIQSTCSMTTNS